VGQCFSEAAQIAEPYSDQVRGGSAAHLSVPSAIVPETFNVLLKPAHRDARRIVIVQTGEHAIDPRLLK